MLVERLETRAGYFRELQLAKEGNWEDGDFDTDGIVGYQDFLFLAKNFGSGPNA